MSEQLTVWAEGDRCQLVVLAEGVVYLGRIAKVFGPAGAPICHVQTDNGRAYSILASSSFLQRSSETEGISDDPGRPLAEPERA